MGSTIEKVTITYDGGCPICDNYVRYAQLNSVAAKIELVDARKHPALVTALMTRGVDMNRGFLVRVGEQEYFGAEAIHVLGLLTSPIGMLNRIHALLFARPPVARLVYPFLALSRRLLLRFLGRPML